MLLLQLCGLILSFFSLTTGLSSVALTPPTSPPDQQLPPGDGSGALYTGGSTLDPSLGDDGDDSCTGALIHKVTSKVWSQWLTETAPPTPPSGGAAGGGTLPNGSMAATPGTITNTSGGTGTMR